MLFCCSRSSGSLIYTGIIPCGRAWRKCGTMAILPLRSSTERGVIWEPSAPGSYPPVPITVSVEELLNSAMNQNFIPVVDDYNSFIGLVTRREIISRLSNQKPETLRRIV